MASAEISLAALITVLLPTTALLGQQASSSSGQNSVNPTASAMVVPVCTERAKGYRRIGWGSAGLQFDVPKTGVKVLFGRPDADYLEDVIRPKDSQGWLQLWFGPYAISPKEGEDLIAGSSKSSRRNVVTAKGIIVGWDAYGVLKNGERWRQTAAGGSGSIYRTRSSRDAAVFDHIVNSMCVVPRP